MAALMLLLCLSCAPLLTATRAEVMTPGAARVVLKEIDDNELSFVVYNLSPQPMAVDRDAVRLLLSSGPRSREPGMGTRVYSIPPGGFHAVNVKFNLDGVGAGETLWVHFQEAISIEGQLVPVEPIALVAR
jgi:hypothetical protein